MLSIIYKVFCYVIRCYSISFPFNTLFTSLFLQVSKLSKGEMLMVNIGSTSTGGSVLSVKNDVARLQLTQPVCTQESEKVTLSRRVEGHWRYVTIYYI